MAFLTQLKTSDLIKAKPLIKSTTKMNDYIYNDYCCLLY